MKKTSLILIGLAIIFVTMSESRADSISYSTKSVYGYLDEKATVTSSQNWSLPLTSIGPAVSFPLFDPSLGAFTGARFDIHYETSRFFEAQTSNDDWFWQSSSVHADAAFQSYLNFSLLPSYNAIRDTYQYALGVDCSGNDGCYASSGPTPWNGNYIVNLDNTFVGFIGNGTFTTNVMGDAIGSIDVDDDVISAWRHAVYNARYDVTLTYNYTPPTPVPEPATLLLVGFGLVGLAGVRRFGK